MKQISLLLLVIVLASPVFGQEKANDDRFIHCNVFVDTQGKPLAAWQFELVYDPKTVAIVGVEGGEADPFGPGNTPHYDPRGLREGKIVVAAFSTRRSGLPTGRFRVARLHLQVKGAADPKLTVRLTAAGTVGGKRIPALIQTQIQLKKETKR